MHAAISELMKYPAYGGATSVPAQDQAIADYVDRAGGAASLLRGVHITAHTHQVTLSNDLGTDPNGAAKREFALARMRGTIANAADAFIVCQASVGSDDLAKALLLRLAESNAKLFEDLVSESRKKEGALPIGPGFFMLQAIEGK